MDQSYRLVNLTVEWCKKFFTPPQIKRRKQLIVMVHNSPDYRVYGEFCQNNNWLTINLGVCHDVRDIIKTTIHEYTHHCQRLDDYAVMSKKVGYANNPYEVEAVNNEEQYYKNCWRSIKAEIL